MGLVDYGECVKLGYVGTNEVPQNTRNISLGSSLTAGDESSSYIISPTGDFAFGFQLVATRTYLLSIWFNNIPSKTITWSANRDSLAQIGSELKLDSDGRLVLTDPGGSEMWSATASHLNTGNLVLVDDNSIILWQSFDVPTDTILPTQVMKQSVALVELGFQTLITHSARRRESCVLYA